MKLVQILALVGAISMLLVFSHEASAKEFIKMSTLGPGSSPNLVMTTFATLVNQNSNGEIEIQVNATGAAPKHAIEAAQGKTDVFMYAPLINAFMKDNKAMFKKVEKAPQFAEKLRGILSFPIGSYHFTTTAASGIESLADIKGKKIFTGPPVGAARVISERMIKAVTGYESGKDYEAVKLGWGAASQAFQDGQLDVYVNPTNAPSPVIQQVALSKKIRLLGIPDDMMDNPEIVKLWNRPGGKIGIIAPDAYGENQVNDKPVNTVAAVVGIGAGEHVDEEVVYQMTKLFWENIDAESGGTPWLRKVTKEGALDQMNIPLHPGALRYYEEIGMTILDNLR